jgi:hypothetical protein
MRSNSWHAGSVFVLSLSLLAAAPLEGQQSFVRGHVDEDGAVNLSDAVQVFRYLFQGDAEPPCLDAADADDSGFLNLTDGIHILGFLFQGGPPPAGPYPTCGSDASADDLGCGRFSACAPDSALRVIGRTLDTELGPVVGARVTAGGQFAFSAFDGSFIIDDVARAALVRVSAEMGGLSGRKEIGVDASMTVVDAGDIVLTPGDACGNVVARAADRGCGRVLVWGDEHVIFDEYLPGSRPFWENALGWLAEPTCSEGERTRLGNLHGALHEGVEQLAAELGFEVTQVSSLSSLESVDILIVRPFGGPGGPELKEWVEAGGALMTLVAGVGDSHPDECDGANALLTPLGIEYDCFHKAPWGPVNEFGNHPVALGLLPDNAPFVNGRWVVDVPGFTSDIVARVGECSPPEVPDCRKPIAFDGSEPVVVEGACEEGNLNGGSNASTGEPELNILGVYEGEGPVTVRVERARRMVLFLSSHDPVMWKVEVGPLASLEKVFVSGFQASSAVVPEGIPVERITNPLGSGYGNDCGGGNTPKLVETAESASGLRMRSFHGCYRASGFTIR